MNMLARCMFSVVCPFRRDTLIDVISSCGGFCNFEIDCNSVYFNFLFYIILHWVCL